MSWRGARVTLYVAAATLAPVVWEIGVALLIIFRHPMSEMATLAIAKIGFAMLLGLIILIGRRARQWGFLGGLRLDTWGLLWPIWLASAISLAQDLAQPEALRLLVWLPIAFAVAIGEEGIFRGMIIAALDPARPRRRAIISALMFGLVHLSALATPLDWRMVVAQASAALGLGLILGAVRLRSRSIWPGIIVHGVLDWTGLAAVNGLEEALAYSTSGAIYMMIGAAVAAGWGLYLCRTLPAPSEDPGIGAEPIDGLLHG